MRVIVTATFTISEFDPGELSIYSIAGEVQDLMNHHLLDQLEQRGQEPIKADTAPIELRGTIDTGSKAVLNLRVDN